MRTERKQIRQLVVDRVVNCARADDHSGHPLIRSLLAGGLATLDPSGLGLRTWDARMVDARGIPRDGLWAIGPVRRAELWETTAIPEIREQAAELAVRLAVLCTRGVHAIPVP